MTKITLFTLGEIKKIISEKYGFPLDGIGIWDDYNLYLRDDSCGSDHLIDVLEDSYVISFTEEAV